MRARQALTLNNTAVSKKEREQPEKKEGMGNRERFLFEQNVAKIFANLGKWALYFFTPQLNVHRYVNRAT